MKANRTLILNALLLVVLLESCKKNKLTIGQSYQGGIIFYIDASGKHGLIAAPGDQGQAPWGCPSTVISGADGSIIGTGCQNTIDIMNSCSTAGIAARLCGDLVLGGYSDWYLPSKDELNQLYINRDAIENFISYSYPSQSKGYWSSTEQDFFAACRQTFAISNAGQQGHTPKYNSCSVRAVRSF
jgi:hypothetical protein